MVNSLRVRIHTARSQTLLFNLRWWQLPPRGKWLWITKLLCPNYPWNIFRLGEKLTFLLPMLGTGSGLTGEAYISRENKIKYCIVPRWERGKQIFHQVAWLRSWCKLAQFHWFHLAIPNVYTFSSFEDRRTHSSGYVKSQWLSEERCSGSKGGWQQNILGSVTEDHILVPGKRLETGKEWERDSSSKLCLPRKPEQDFVGETCAVVMYFYSSL